jgi:hypothetical protein
VALAECTPVHRDPNVGDDGNVGGALPFIVIPHVGNDGNLIVEPLDTQRPGASLANR